MGFSATLTRFTDLYAVFTSCFCHSLSIRLFPFSTSPSFLPTFLKIKCLPCPRPAVQVRWMLCQTPYVCSCVLSSPPPPQLSPFTFGRHILPPAYVLILYWQHREFRCLVNSYITAHSEEFRFYTLAWESSVKDVPRCKNFFGSSYGCSGTTWIKLIAY